MKFELTQIVSEIKSLCDMAGEKETDSVGKEESIIEASKQKLVIFAVKGSP